MPTLIVFRHGKSDWSAPARGDHERPLKKRGLRAAQRMGRFLTTSGLAPDLVLYSSAVRARETARLAHEAGGWEAPLQETPALYEAAPGDVIELLRLVDDDVQTLLVVGHEPTSSDLVSWLTGGRRPAFPTAAMACIELAATSWAALDAGCGYLSWLVTPRLLDDPSADD